MRFVSCSATIRDPLEVSPDVVNRHLPLIFACIQHMKVLFGINVGGNSSCLCLFYDDYI